MSAVPPYWAWQRIRRIVGLRDLFEPQQPPGHLHHLGLVRLAEAGDGAFHLHGGVFIGGYPVLLQRQHGDPPCLRHVDGGGLVALEIQLLDRCRLRMIPLQQHRHIVVDDLQPPVEGDPRLRGDRTEIQRQIPSPLKADDPPAHDGIAGVNA